LSAGGWWLTASSSSDGDGDGDSRMKAEISKGGGTMAVDVMDGANS